VLKNAHFCATYQMNTVSVGLMTSSVYIIHARILASKFSWTCVLNKWKFRVFIGLIILHRAACSLTVWHTACHTMHCMVELLEAVGMRQVGERCTCMSMSNNSQTLVYDETCIRCPATHQCTHTCAGLHADPLPSKCLASCLLKVILGFCG